MLQAAGNAPENAAELARAITEWVGSASPARDPAVLSAEYRAAGLDYTPPKSPLESIDELERVRGMTPDLLSALRPHLTLFGPAEPNPASADPVVARAIVLAGGLSSGVAPGGASGAPNAVPETALARIRTAAQGPDNAEFFRTAIARVTSEGYALLAWGTNDVE